MTNMRRRRLPAAASREVLALLLLALVPTASAQHNARRAAPKPPPEAHILMLSDVHFDPFRDPGKLNALRQAPVEQWQAIFESPASPSAVDDLTHLQQTCQARGLDTDWPLWKRSLEAIRDADPHPDFALLPGDLMTHQFECRFRTAAVLLAARAQPKPQPWEDAPPPPKPPADTEIAAFAVKTVQFVTLTLRQNLSEVPVYAALGNNDSGCADYRETPGSPFLKGAAAAFAEAAIPNPASNPALVATLTTEASTLGDYALTLPAPMEKTRLLVLQDLFESTSFQTCASTTDRNPEKQQIDWLRQQLTEARTAGEHAWVLGHIAPSVDVYTSFHRYILAPDKLCSAPVVSMLETAVSPNALADTLTSFSDVVTLAVFGHTHTDSFAALRSSNSSGNGNGVVPVRVVPSISPINGNHPAFSEAVADPQTAVLKDWSTLVSPSPQGSTPPWAEGYRFSQLYEQPDFSAAAAERLTAAMAADRTGRSAPSTAFRRNFYAGDFGLFAAAAEQIWPAYACSLRETRLDRFHSCLCPAAASAPKP